MWLVDIGKLVNGLRIWPLGNTLFYKVGLGVQYLPISGLLKSIAYISYITYICYLYQIKAKQISFNMIPNLTLYDK